ncbi:MAG: TspO/MBR family protein [Candidatus Jorgensenbacteria bacterium]
MTYSRPVKLLIAVGFSLSAGAIGSIFTAMSVGTWLPTLIKSALYPPAWLFGPVWTVLYILMGVAAYFVWDNSRVMKEEKKRALEIFALQLVLNASWSVLFFGAQSPFLALICIVLLWLSILWTIVAFSWISRPAAWLLAPYFAWVAFATYLNAAIWALN